MTSPVSLSDAIFGQIASSIASNTPDGQVKVKAVTSWLEQQAETTVNMRIDTQERITKLLKQARADGDQDAINHWSEILASYRGKRA